VGADSAEIAPVSVSEQFWQVWPAGGQRSIDCACGRTHFSNSERAGTWDDGELERLREKAKADPESHIAHSDDSVSAADIGGIVYVWDCPCGYGERIERFLTENRAPIMRYIKACIESEAAQSSRDLALLAAVRLTRQLAP
jgi:hypothetical protein